MWFLNSVIVDHMFNVCTFINHTSIDSFFSDQSMDDITICVYALCKVRVEYITRFF